jgi:hypothetical protein
MGVLRDTLGARTPGDPPAAARAFGSGQAEPVTQAFEPSAPPSALAAGPPQPSPAGEERSELRRRRDSLAEQVADLHWDLGGLTYEMAIRDHFRLDVLVRRAAILQERDAELAEVERLLRTEEGGAAGACPNCSAPHSRGAVYCWQCGGALMERMQSSRMPAAAADGDLTGAESLDALLAPRPDGLADPTRDDV